MKLLLHICCGPCAVYPVGLLRESGATVHGLYFNPNIHPYQEFIRRRDTLEKWAHDTNLPVILSDNYDLEGYLRETVYRETQRCRFCYLLRLKEAAHIARRGKFDAFSTTLLYSKFQKHDLIADIGREIGRQQGVEFHYQDFREGWKEGIRLSKALGMYRQEYCGCIYSERDRFAPRTKKEVIPHAP